MRDDDFLSELIERRDKCLTELENYNRLIAQLTGEAQTLTPSPAVSDRWDGWKPKDAMKEYMRSLRGGKVTLAKLAEDLIAGGVIPGQPRGRKTDPFTRVVHQIKISIRQMHKRPIYDVEPAGKLDGVDPREIFISMRRKS